MSNPHRTVVLAVVLGIVLPVAGCAASTGGSAGSGGATEISPSTAGPADSGPPPLPDSSPPSTPALVPITPQPGERERVAQWRLADRSDDRRLLLDVTVGGPPCDTVTGVDIAETGTTVTVTVHAGRLTSADCPPGVAGALATARVAAQLARPLGDRELLGGAS
jgi:hypothetical protein